MIKYVISLGFIAILFLSSCVTSSNQETSQQDQNSNQETSQMDKNEAENTSIEHVILGTEELKEESQRIIRMVFTLHAQYSYFDLSIPGLTVTKGGNRMEFDNFSLKDFSSPYESLTGIVEILDGRFIWNLQLAGGPVLTFEMDEEYEKFRGYGRKTLNVIADGVELEVEY